MTVEQYLGSFNDISLRSIPAHYIIGHTDDETIVGIQGLRLELDNRCLAFTSSWNK